MDSIGPKHIDKYGSRLSPIQISVRVPRTASFITWPNGSPSKESPLIPDISLMQQHGFPTTQQIQIIWFLNAGYRWITKIMLFLSENLSKNILFLVQIRLQRVHFIEITKNSYQQRLASKLKGSPNLPWYQMNSPSPRAK